MSAFLPIVLAAELVLPVAEVRGVADRRPRDYPGRVVAIQKVDVVPQVSGEILEVCFENGSDVKSGDVLYRLDPVKYEAAVKNAESKLAEAKANGVHGKAVTPFLLAKVKELTGGDSLASNIQLVYNNARLAAKTAAALAALEA